MTDNSSSTTDAQPDDKVQQLEQRVAELESMTEIGAEDDDGWSMGDLLGLGLTRRQALTALALLGAGYALGPAITKALAEPAAASHGGATLGTQDNPLEAIYVEDLNQTTDNIVADSVSTDEITSESLSYDYILRTDGSTIDALPQSSNLSKYTGETDIGPLLETLIVDELSPKGSRKEAAGSILAKRGIYPGSLDNASGGAAPPLPTSCHIYGEGRNHLDPDGSSAMIPEDEPMTEFRTDSVGFVQPDVDDDLASFPMLSDLKIGGPGAETAGTIGLDGSTGSNRWDWLLLDNVVVMDFNTPVDFSSSHDTRAVNSHFLRFSAVVSGPDKHIWDNCGFWSYVSGSSVDTQGGSKGHTRFKDCIFTNTAGSGNAQVLIEGHGAELRGNRFVNANSDSGNAIAVYGDQGGGQVKLIGNYFPDDSNSSYDATIYFDPDSSHDVIAFNQDHTDSDNSINIAGYQGGSDTWMVGNNLTNGINELEPIPRLRVNGQILSSGAPDATNFTSADAGVGILDTSASPPDQYWVAMDGTLLGPK